MVVAGVRPGKSPAGIAAKSRPRILTEPSRSHHVGACMVISNGLLNTRLTHGWAAAAPLSCRDSAGSYGPAPGGSRSSRADSAPADGLLGAARKAVRTAADRPQVPPHRPPHRARSQSPRRGRSAAPRALPPLFTGDIMLAPMPRRKPASLTSSCRRSHRPSPGKLPITRVPLLFRADYFGR